MDERVAQKRSHRETYEEDGQFTNPRLIHREGEEADKRNETYCDNTGKGKDNDAHGIQLWACPRRSSTIILLDGFSFI